MAHYHDDGNGNVYLSIIMFLVSILNYNISFVHINIYSWEIPTIAIQTIALIAGAVSITSGIIAIRKNSKK